MRPPAVTAILEEHQALTAVLRLLQLRIAQGGRDGAPDFTALRTMLLLLEEYPARLHHANERQVLFPRIRQRCPALGPVLDRLVAEQCRSDAAARDLSRALLAYEVLGASRREAFEQLAHAYITGFLGHLEVEDNYILTVAMDYLDADDWCEIERAWGHGPDAEPDPVCAEYRQLFRRVLFRERVPVHPGDPPPSTGLSSAMNATWR